MDLERISQPFGKCPALIVVDVIKGFTDPRCPLGSDCASVVEANKALLDIFRAEGFPVFFTTTLYRDPTEATVFRHRIPALNLLTPESQWVEVDDMLMVGPEEPIIEKKWASAFFETDMAEQLTNSGADCLVVTGLTTSGCVRATVLDGLQNDYAVFVPEEAVGDRNSHAHTANLFDLHAKYADVTTVNWIRNACQEGR